MGNKSIHFVIVLIFCCVICSTLNSNASAFSGGPDPFGYSFKDSVEVSGPSYNWIEIAPPEGGSGIVVPFPPPADDEYSFPISLPFTFNFYGTGYSTLAVATNGSIYFTNNYVGFQNNALPGATIYKNDTLIAHLWDDLIVNPGAVYYQTFPDKIVIEYYHISGMDPVSSIQTPAWGTWEVILFSNGSIIMQFKKVDFGNPALNAGAGATVGVQRDALTALQYSYNTPFLSPNLAICFAYPGEKSDCSIKTAVSQVQGASVWSLVVFAFCAGISSLYFLAYRYKQL